MKRSFSEESDGESQVEIYCICRTSDSTRFMICCDFCNEWYHGDCINISQEKANDIEKFFCESCLKSKPGLKIIYKKHVKIAKMKEKIYRDKQQISGKCGKCKGCLKMFDCGKCDICKEKMTDCSLDKTHKKCKERICVYFRKIIDSDIFNIKKKYQNIESNRSQIKSQSSNKKSNIVREVVSHNITPKTGTTSHNIFKTQLPTTSSLQLNKNNSINNIPEEGSIKYPKILKSYLKSDSVDLHDEIERPDSAVSEVKTETCYERDFPISSKSVNINEKVKLEENIKIDSGKIVNHGQDLNTTNIESPNLSPNSPEDDTSDDPDFKDDHDNKGSKMTIDYGNKLKKAVPLEQQSNSHHPNVQNHSRAVNSEDHPISTGKRGQQQTPAAAHLSTSSANKKSSLKTSSEITPHKGGDKIVSHNYYPNQQCHGPKCVKSNRPGSKYCSDECGHKLATKRIFEFLPMRIQQWQNNHSISDLKNKAQWEKVRAKQIASQSTLEQLNRDREMLERKIHHCKSLALDPDQDNLDSEVDETEISIFCVTCGHPINPKTAIRHMEKCFSKVESQTSYGSIYKTNVGMDLFCDAYNAESQTYCKRLKVLCPEHTKDPKVNEYEVCGCPLTADVFQESGEFCRASKKRCMKHYNWEKLRRAQIDMEKVRQLLILDDLFEEERQIRLQLSKRSGALGLILHQTIPHNNPALFNSQMLNSACSQPPPQNLSLQTVL